MIRDLTLYLILVIIILPCTLMSYEKYAMLNLSVPSDLEARQMQFTVAHRFYGVATKKPIESFFGAQGGANPSLGLRIILWKGIGISGSYVFNDPSKSYTIGLQYTLPFPVWISRFQVEGEYFSFEQEVDCRKSHLFFQMVSRMDSLFNRFTPVFNLGYDGYYEKMGLGLGANIQLSEKIHFIGEYYPLINSDSDNLKASFAFGLKILTYGHHFHLLCGNSYALGNRILMGGAISNDLHLGFTIHRFFEF